MYIKKVNSPRYISSFSVIVSFIAVALLGCVMLPLLPVRLSPSEALPGITVSFSMPGSSARTVESEITSRLESMFARVTDVKHIKSRSWSGGGSVILEFDRHADMETARFETAMIVRQAWGELPAGAAYPRIAVRQVDDDASRPFMSYTVNARQSPSEIIAYCEKYIKPVISVIPGIAKVELSGATPMEWQIEYDSPAMAQLGITPDMITAALNANFSEAFLGIASPTPADSGSYMRVTIAPLQQSGRLNPADILITTHNRQLISLDKIARVTHTEAAPTGYFRINGLNSIYLNITAADNANQIELSALVRKTLAAINLPEGYMLTNSYDASISISEELDNIYFRTALTVLILLVFVGIITMSWRYLMLIAIGLTINMAVAIVAYYIFKVEIHLYSLAGITISLNLVIDNLIVMTEHAARCRDRRVFSAILAATLTTVGALSVVFFLDEKTMLSLKDFVLVVIINLAVSLLVALFLVPALIERMQVRKRRAKRRRTHRIPAIAAHTYTATVRFLCRHKAIVYTILILAFGLPVFMLPEKIEGDTRWATIYNSTIGSSTYKDNIKPWVDRCLGGTLRLFVEKVYSGAYWNNGQNEPTLYINATLPNGSTLGQMNNLISKMEVFLATQDGVRQFQTNIYSPRRGSITVMFKPEHQADGFPYRLKSDAISKALTLGGGSWSVYGLEDKGFNNDVREGAGSYRVKLSGYNYDELYARAEILRDTLLAHRRIREVTLSSDFSYWKDDYTEFYLDIDKKRLAKDSITVSDVYRALNREIGRDIQAGSIFTTQGAEAITMHSSEIARDVWGLMNIPFDINGRNIKLSDYAKIEKRQTPPNIVKEDQEYVLCLQYEYIGSGTQGEKVLDRMIANFTPTLPLGYTAEKQTYTWNNNKSAAHYLLLALIVIIIFFISAILFNSLRQPLAIILVIPVSFIGVFITFYAFELKFDQGGFAAFILLCGITVNAAIYIINEYNNLRQRHPAIEPRKLYHKAFSLKITAVLLTVLSTVLGFIPFLIGQTRESFWFPLAAGTMGGLIMSLVAILFLLPILIIPRPTTTTSQPAKNRPPNAA